MTAPVLSLSGVRYAWPGRTAFSIEVEALSVAHGETVLLLGESGSGKSTLLSLICGTVLADQGVVAVDGQDLSQLSSSARDRFRAEWIGVIFQQFNLLPFGTVQDNIALPLRFAPTRRDRVLDVAGEAARLCSALGLPGGILTEKAARLSVGQQQRVAVARALIGEPSLIVADEPTSALDAGSQTAFLDLMFQQITACRASLLMVSHDPALGQYFDRVVRMEDVARVERRMT
ncbi:ABC transporter ATP-binding protein [Pontivivens insulae]|uniref:Putative ABC transporter ATP-binding protein n=1 Tax=Pontivivens insulae TaxID=1639689 RepID=A0A2R8A7H9_9RHOB|nr:ATP-binding cassette domain-containing protein [Pontivivens insulae]RED18083.1 putative ABC transport system ATP-binding protein [Pontivivens insulae]SPF27980.1 putative ABC transporter ATP-binding protein [Pontivivens insulae]